MKNVKTYPLILFFLLYLTFFSYAQDERAIKKIQAGSDVSKLYGFSIKFEDSFQKSNDEALRIAAKRNLLIFKDNNGQIVSLHSFDRSGYPKYLVTHNLNAAKTVSNNKVYNGGDLGLNLSGSNMKAGVWDGGIVRTSHQEFNNTGTARIVNVNSGVENSHSTHVAGTIAAGGVLATAKGMAFNALVDAYEWNSDFSEMSLAAANGLLLSNHSYGFIGGWYYDGIDWYWYGNTSLSSYEDASYGFYDSYSVDVDNIAYNAPYYLIVKSSGNDAFYGPTTQPVLHKVWSGSDWTYATDVREINGGADGYDCINSWGNAKNVLTVGAVNDIVNGYSQPSDAVLADFSSRGPSDDGRIKPDIVANGTTLTSTDISNNSNVFYSEKSGTSMAAPSVTGSLLLLQEHYNNLHGLFMKSATLKALAIHTADECGTSEGPDYQFGWGLLNIATAASVITKKDVSAFIKEETLTNGNSYALNVDVTGNTPLTVTVVWTDVEGTSPTPQLDPANKMLVNDIDVKIQYAANTFYPYCLNPLNPSAPATKANNNTDNVEKIYINAPSAGTYTITVDHKGTLTGGAQNFSLIVTGISLGFAEVETQAISNIAKTSANVSGEVVFDNGIMVTERGFVYNATGNPTINDNKIVAGTGTGVFSATLTNLCAATDFYVAAYATNATGTVYGAPKKFTTLCGVVTQFPFTENFNAEKACPVCWDVVDNQGNNQVWQFGEFLPLGLTPPIFVTTGNYAYLNSEGFGSGNKQNSDLISPVFDFSGYSSVTLTFKHYFRSYSSSSAKLFYSIDDGATWVLVRTFTGTTNPATYTKNWTTTITNQPHVRFKWTYVYSGSSTGYYWSVDDISVTAIAAGNLTVDNGSTIISSNMAYNNVTIESDGMLTVEGDMILTVTGDLIIKSDATGTGSVLNKGLLCVGGNTTVQKYLPDYATSGWNIASPVIEADQTVVAGADAVYFYNSALPGWQQFTTGNLQPATGYVVRFPLTTTLQFNGGLNNGNISRNNLIRTPSNFGWNYLGNPYPSPVDWNLLSKTNLNNSVYYRMASGNVAAYVAGIGVNGGSNIIPAMQAFWVQVNANQTSGAIEFNNNARLHAANDSYKSIYDEVLRLVIESNTGTDETVIRFSDSASYAFDSHLDALKMFSQDIEMPQIFSVSESNDMAISTLPSLLANLTVPVGINGEASKIYSISVSGMNTFDKSIGITLEDKHEGVLIDLRQKPNYTFTQNAEGTDRFAIHFNVLASQSESQLQTTTEPVVYTSGQSVYVYNITEKGSELCLYNMIGQKLLTHRLQVGELNRVETNLPTGAYIVKVLNDTLIVSKNVVLSD